MDQNSLYIALHHQMHCGVERLRKTGNKLVHYTSAENGLKIITGRKVWMRSSSLMNDFDEIGHGQRCLDRALQSDGGRRFIDWLNSIFPPINGESFSDNIREYYELQTSIMRVGTFLTSLSEHPSSEDEYGRLSMWRAYGGRAGVAIVVNTEPFTRISEYLKAYTIPVMYKTPDDFVVWFKIWSEIIIKHEAVVRSYNRDTFKEMLFDAFREFGLSTKHPGFGEEREWRVYHSPTIDKSSPLQIEHETISGLPQPIIKISLLNVPEHGFTGIEPAELIDKIIIGPTEHPGAIFHAYWHALINCGFDDPGPRIKKSDIPLRHY